MKRKSNACSSGPGSTPNPIISLTSLDAALDLLVCDTFTRLDALSSKFEVAAGIKLNDGVVKKRWDEAVKRWEVMRSIDELCCGSSRIKAAAAAAGSLASTSNEAKQDVDWEVKMDEEGCENEEVQNGNGKRRPLPHCPHPGAVATFDLCPDEEAQWRRWTPKLNDVVLVELGCGEKWPGKIIDKKVFFQGRTVPRGNHFFPVRIYDEDHEPVISVKSRMIPLHLRPSPAILASPALQSAYHHATNPTTFDMLASARESGAAHNRTHPGVNDEKDKENWKIEKETWKKTVSWIMDERRIEKLRALSEERERRFKEVSTPEDDVDERDKQDASPWSKFSIKDESDDWDYQKKRKISRTEPDTRNKVYGSQPVGYLSLNGKLATISKVTNPDSSDISERGGIFRVSPIVQDGNNIIQTTPHKTLAGSPLLASYIRPSLLTPQRPLSPRRLARRGSLDPRPRGGTYTPPRVLPSGDETAPYSSLSLPTTSGSPAPSLRKFDFVSPLGPVRFGRLNDDEVDLDGGNDHGGAGRSPIPRSGSFSGLDNTNGHTLPVVHEEREKEESDDLGFWTTVVRGGRKGRAGSAPCRDKEKMGLDTGGTEASVVVVGGDSMEL